MSGLTAAFEALQAGYRVSLYEQSDRLGGKLCGRISQSGGLEEHAFRVFLSGRYFALTDLLSRAGLSSERILKPVRGRYYIGDDPLVLMDERGVTRRARSFVKHCLNKGLFGDIFSAVRIMVQAHRVHLCNMEDAGFAEVFGRLDRQSSGLARSVLDQYMRLAVGSDPARSKALPMADGVLNDILFPGHVKRTAAAPWQTTFIEPITEFLHETYPERFSVHTNCRLTAVRADSPDPALVTGLVFKKRPTPESRYTDTIVVDDGDYWVLAIPRREAVRLGALDQAHCAGDAVWSFCVDINLARLTADLAQRFRGFTAVHDCPWAVIAALYVPASSDFADHPGCIALEGSDASRLPDDVQAILRVTISQVHEPGTYVAKPFLHCTPEEALTEISGTYKLASCGIDLERDVVFTNWGPGIEFVSGTEETHRQQATDFPHWTIGPHNSENGGWWRTLHTLDSQLVGEPFTTSVSSDFSNVRICGEAVFDRHDFGVYVASMEVAARSAKHAIQTILEAEGSTEKIFPFGTPLYSRSYRLKRSLFRALERFAPKKASSAKALKPAEPS